MYTSAYPSPELRQSLQQSIATLGEAIKPVWQQIHNQPEIGYQEFIAAKLLSTWLQEHGFRVQQPIAQMETAFSADQGATGPLVVYLAEYDALPGLGHACGHSLSGIASVLAGTALAKIALAGSNKVGQVRILGTPAEEAVVPDSGGKLKCIQAGFLAGAEAALMAHAGNRSILQMDIVARAVLNLEWLGVASHAGAAPHMGRNALSAAVVALTGINALYQQLETGSRLNAIMTHGGSLVNTIPDYAAVTVQLRAPSRLALSSLVQRVENCAQAGALATGCELKVSMPSPSVSDFRHNSALLDVYEAELQYLSQPYVRYEPLCISTDAGNASYAVPAIHPLFGLDCPGIELHSHNFAKACSTAAAWKNTLDAACALACTGYAVLQDTSLRKAMQQEFISN